MMQQRRAAMGNESEGMRMSSQFGGVVALVRPVLKAVLITLQMSRLQPYRSRVPVHILQLMDVASRITLFMVGQAGPLSFTFKDRLDNKHKSSIGPQPKCTCAPQRHDHCIHTLYILLKIFKISVDNPLVWQAAYVDSELSDLLSGKHTTQPTRRPRPSFQPISEQFSPPELPSELILMRKRQTQIVSEALVDRMELNEDSVCPICQQDLKPDMCLSYCKFKCGNNYHLECLKVWVGHKAQEGSSISCPMCRVKFPHNFLAQLQREEQAYARKESKKIQIDFNCGGCGVKIPIRPHKCLLCTAYELCEACYSGKKHIKHPFIVRGEDGRWRGAEQRRDEQLKIKNFIEAKRKQTYNDEILKKLRKVQEDPNKLIDFVAAAYPYVSKYISDKIDPRKKLDFDPSDIRCFKCGATRMLFLRRLSCGHFIDHECLKDCVVKEKFYCDQDGTQFLKGYQNLRQKEKIIEQKRSQLMAEQVSPEFKVNYMEAQSDYNFLREPQAPTLTEVLSGRESHAYQSQLNRQQRQVRARVTSNMIRPPPRSNSRRTIREPPVHNTPPNPILRERRGTSVRANDIRVRNVSRGVVTNRNRGLSNNIDLGQNQIMQGLLGRRLGL